MTDRTNPKDAVASRKVGLSVLPARVLYEVALGLMEGAVKYGPFNWRRSRVRVMVYIDAAKRHLDQFAEGEDLDSEMPKAYRVHHISKAIAGLMIVRDALMRGSAIDDRPPPTAAGWLGDLNAKAATIPRDRTGPRRARGAKTRRPAKRPRTGRE